MTLRLVCRQQQDTVAVGQAIGEAARPGLVVALQGPLGSGKTVLTKGVAKGLGVAEWRYVTSPTFALHNVYTGRLRLHHVDLYRLADPGELEDLGLEDSLYGLDVCVIEWPDIFFEDLPRDRLWIRFLWGPLDERVLDIESAGQVSDAVCSELGRVACELKPREEGP